MTAPIAVPDMTRICLRAITAAADAGEVCPTNARLSELMDAESLATGARHVALLENLGLIVVHRSQSSRVVKIVATGKHTAGKATDGSAHIDRHGRSRAGITTEKLAIFADRLAEGDTIDAARRATGLNPHYGKRMFDQVCADLGPQAA